MDVSKLVMQRDNLYIFCIFQIPEQFRFMSQHPVKKKHKHKKHKSQDNERNKEGGEAVSQSGQEQEKLASSSTGMKNCQFCCTHIHELCSPCSSRGTGKEIDDVEGCLVQEGFKFWFLDDFNQLQSQPKCFSFPFTPFFFLFQSKILYMAMKFQL